MGIRNPNSTNYEHSDEPNLYDLHKAMDFGAQNGVYFGADGTTLNLVVRKYTSGSVDDTTEKIPQSQWGV